VPNLYLSDFVLEREAFIEPVRQTDIAGHRGLDHLVDVLAIQLQARVIQHSMETELINGVTMEIHTLITCDGDSDLPFVAAVPTAVAMVLEGM
jgi:hypothetical protein